VLATYHLIGYPLGSFFSPDDGYSSFHPELSWTYPEYTAMHSEDSDHHSHIGDTPKFI
jgi:hypothetical protein